MTSRSSHPLAVVAAVREALRNAGVPRTEIADFSAEAMSADDHSTLLRVCRDWVGSTRAGSTETATG